MLLQNILLTNKNRGNVMITLIYKPNCLNKIIFNTLLLNVETLIITLIIFFEPTFYLSYKIYLIVRYYLL